MRLAAERARRLPNYVFPGSFAACHTLMYFRHPSTSVRKERRLLRRARDLLSAAGSWWLEWNSCILPGVEFLRKRAVISHQLSSDVNHSEGFFESEVFHCQFKLCLMKHNQSVSWWVLIKKHSFTIVLWINTPTHYFSTHINNYRQEVIDQHSHCDALLACCSHMLSSFCSSEHLNKEKASLGENFIISFVQAAPKWPSLKNNIIIFFSAINSPFLWRRVDWEPLCSRSTDMMGTCVSAVRPGVEVLNSAGVQWQPKTLNELWLLWLLANRLVKRTVTDLLSLITICGTVGLTFPLVLYLRCGRPTIPVQAPLFEAKTRTRKSVAAICCLSINQTCLLSSSVVV